MALTQVTTHGILDGTILNEDIASSFNLNVFLVTLCYLMAQTERIFA